MDLCCPSLLFPVCFFAPRGKEGGLCWQSIGLEGEVQKKRITRALAITTEADCQQVGDGRPCVFLRTKFIWSPLQICVRPPWEIEPVGEGPQQQPMAAETGQKARLKRCMRPREWSCGCKHGVGGDRLTGNRRPISNLFVNCFNRSSGDEPRAFWLLKLIFGHGILGHSAVHPPHIALPSTHFGQPCALPTIHCPLAVPFLGRIQLVSAEVGKHLFFNITSN